MDEKVFLTLGILKVAACLEMSGHIVEMMDLSGVEGFEQAMAAHTSSTEAVMFGITATSPQLPSAIAIAHTIREIKPHARIILGGPHITLVNAAMKRERKLGMIGRACRAYDSLCRHFDVLVAGDGEFSIFQAISDKPPKLIDADVPNTELFLTPQQMNEVPWPARHLVDVESYHYFIEGERALSMLLQTGCPFLCGFCGGRESPMLRRIRMRSTENAVDEMRFMHRTYGTKAFQLYDDELNVNPSMVELMNAISDLQEELGVDFKLRGFVKSQLFTDEQAAAMYRAGFRWVLIGFESGNPRILENMNKRATRDDNTKCMEIAGRNNLKVKALMSIGHPGETSDTILDTKDWLLEVQPADFDATVITTYPGTAYFDHAIQRKDDPRIWTYEVPKNGDKLHSISTDFEKDLSYYKGKIGEYQSFVFTDALKAEEIPPLRDALENEVRGKLNIPFNQAVSTTQYEASMGLTKLPQNILRTSNDQSIASRSGQKDQSTKAA